MYAPIKCNLEAEKTYAWCTCGASENQPFCDGSHKKIPGQNAPLLFKVDQDSVKGLCTCKFTKNPPYCDGAHKAVP